MFLLLIIGAPFALGTLIATYGFVLRGSLPLAVRPSWRWGAALVVFLMADGVLVVVFLFAIAVYNCHGRYECPF